MPEPSPAQSLRVLVADDCPDGRGSLTLLLTLLGYEVIEAADGISAVQAAREFRPDVALLDLAMPNGNGLEAARQIRQEPDLQDILLVAVTGYGQEEDVARSRQAGFAHHLLKPIDLEFLLALLREHASHLTE